jgi:hypothetical protein
VLVLLMPGFVKYDVEMPVGGNTEGCEVKLWLKIKMDWLPSREYFCYSAQNMFWPR